jgi:TM2 domain-containing membrane protein YozV
MTNSKPDTIQLAKQGDIRAIAALINQPLKPKGITAKVALKNGCLQIMLESAQAPNQSSLAAFIRKGVVSLEIPSIERVRIYGKQLGEEFPAWNQEFELISQDIPNQFFVLEESNSNKEQLQTNCAKNVLEQFMNLRARTAIGISYNDLPPVLGLAKLAVQKFERSPDSEICSYLTEVIQKIMFYYEVSLECLGRKVKSPFGSILPSEPIGKLMVIEFPDVPKSFFSFDYDTILSALWTRAGELTDELDDILNKPVDLDTLKSKQLKFTSSIQAPPTPVKTITPTPVNKRHLAIILAFLLGTAGVHKFYLGYTKEGLIMLAVAVLTNKIGGNYFMFIIGIIEGIIYIRKSDKQFTKTYITNKRGWF